MEVLKEERCSRKTFLGDIEVIHYNWKDTMNCSENSNDVLFSFVLPAYKSTYLAEAIDSILGQIYSNFELVIVDDCSPEPIVDIVESYKDSRIRYFRNKTNIGRYDLVRQWNHSIEFAKGDYLILASDDDLYYPEYLTSMFELIQDKPSIDVFRPRIEQINENGIRISTEPIISLELLSQNDILALMSSRRLFSGIAQYVFKRNSLLKCGGFINYPSAWYSDDATIIALSAKGMAIFDKVLFSIRISEINISSDNSLPTLRNKMIATTEYAKFIKKLNLQSSGILLQSIKKGTLGLFNHLSYKALLYSSWVLFCQRSFLFPPLWLIHRIVGRVYHNVFKNY